MRLLSSSLYALLHITSRIARQTVHRIYQSFAFAQRLRASKPRATLRCGQRAGCETAPHWIGCFTHEDSEECPQRSIRPFAGGFLPRLGLAWLDVFRV